MKKNLALEVYLHADLLGIAPSEYNLHRVDKAIALVDAGDVTPMPSKHLMPGMRVFKVASQNSHSTYTVEVYDAYRSTCTCPDYSPNCKHTLAVRIQDEREKEKAWEGFNMNDEEVVSRWLTLSG